LIGSIVAAVATLPGLGVGTLWDNSETAYGEVAREILLFHDPVVLHLNGAPWFVQPPLYFWIAAAFASMLGITEFALRLPSALATIAMAAAVGYVVARLASSRAALLAAMILSTSLMQAVVGRLAIMDALLDLAVALAILSWFAALRTGGAAWWYGGWLALAFGSLAKGPVALAITLLVVVPWMLWDHVLGRQIVFPSRARWAGGLALFLIIVAPWLVALYRAAGPAAFAALFGHYTLGRYLGTIENQSGPIWYYLPVLILGFFPWFAFFVPAAIAGWREALGPNGSLARLCLCWAVLPLCFFSFAQTKLPNYVALELPALAILVAVWFDRIVDRDDRRAALAWTAVVPLTILGLAFAISAFSRDNRLSGDLHAVRWDFTWLGVAIFVGSLLCFFLLMRRDSAWLGPFALGATSVAVMLIVAVLGEPLVERFKPIPPLAAVIERDLRGSDAIAIQGVSGPNALVFYTRPRVAVLDPPNEATHDSSADPRQTICRAPRAFVIASRRRPSPDPTYGRARRTLAVRLDDVLYLYAGPPCRGFAAETPPPAR